MALRPIDNSLPITPERPRKQSKVSIPIKKQPSLAVNDENNPTLPPSATEIVIDYISSDDLKPLPDPEIKIQGLIEGMESNDWTKICESLNNARQISLYHSTLLIPMLENVLLVLVKSMKNPRSALCKTAIMASSDIFNAFSDNLFESTTSDMFDQLMLQLLLKASQDKKFVCEEAERALNSMVMAMNPLLLLKRLQVYVSHSNPRIRAKAAVSVSYCVSKMGLDGMQEFGLISLVKMAADLLNDRLPEAREAARGIAILVYKKLAEKEEEKVEAWEKFCQENLSPIHALSMVKIIPHE